jgi:hypothetical protein
MNDGAIWARMLKKPARQLEIKKTRANIAALLVRGLRHLKHDGCITAAGEQKKNGPKQGVSSSKIEFINIEVRANSYL